jgi:hypothetical protein
MKRCNWIYFHIAFISLIAGYLVYFFVRPHTPIFAIPNSLQSWRTSIDWLIPVTGSLPDFLHTYAFILLTYLVLGTGSKKHLYFSILLWWVLETVFEMMQWQPLSNLLLQQTAALDFSSLSWFEGFLQHGTYDPLDLFAIAMASVVAYFTVNFISLKDIDL